MPDIIYCTYLTVYSGNKLPPFYIGYSTHKKLTSGYRGSVSSVEYKKIWKDETKSNPTLFKTIILTYHTTAKEALEKESYYQTKLNVVHNPLYTNKAVATVNSFTYSADISLEERKRRSILASQNIGQKNPNYGNHKIAGENNPFYGKKHTEETLQKMRGRKMTPEQKQRLSLARKGKKFNKVTRKYE